MWKPIRRMFGCFRFILAFFVTLYHLGGPHPIGWYSVYGFYVLSGYLMTLVILKKYPLTGGGLVSFEFNRVLRIFPAYLLVMLFSLVMINLPSVQNVAASMEVRPPMGMPEGAWGWFQNIFIYGWQVGQPKLMPHCWSISRELIICSMVFFIFGRNKWLALAWLILSMAWGAFTLFKDLPFFYVYLSHKTAMISYAAGSCIYHFHDKLKGLTRPFPILLGAAIALPFLNEVLSRHAFPNEYVVSPFLINTVFSAYLVLLLSTLRESSKGWVGRMDNLLGNISYPMFLIHWTMGIFVKSLMGGPMERSMTLFFVSIGPIIFAGWAINRFIEQPLVSVRRKTFPTVRSFFEPMLGWFTPARKSEEDSELVLEPAMQEEALIPVPAIEPGVEPAARESEFAAQTQR